MNKKLLVDYHFHPNLSKIERRALRKCKLIWQEFERRQLSVVIVTEHVYKNPPRAFHLLQKSKPPHASTIIFPGMEALTKEGIDLILFSKTAAIYQHTNLVVPKQLFLYEMIDYVNKHDNIFGSVAHPYSIGNSGVAYQLGEDAVAKSIAQLGGVEVRNICLNSLGKFGDITRLSKIFRKKRRWVDWVDYLPDELLPVSAIRLRTGGSDAHVITEIGSGMLVPAPGEETPDKIFTAIATNTSSEFKAVTSDTPLWLAIIKLYTILSESLTKALRLYEGKVYQHDDLFSNFYSETEKEAVESLRKNRVVILKPILNFLTYFSFRPNTLNIISVTSICSSFLLVDYSPFASTISLFTYLTSAGLTGALARYQNAESESGAIAKIAVQYLVLLGAILSIIWFNLGSAFWSAIYLALYTVMLWLLVWLNRVGQPMRLVIRSKYLVVIAIYIYTLFNVNIINPTLIGFSIYMALTNGWMLWRLENASKSKE